MGNQIAIRLHTQHGQEVICESRAHILDWEMAMLSAFSGVLPRTVAGNRGILRWEQIRAVIAPSIYYRAQTGLISLENTHNMAGGTVTPLAVLKEFWAGASEAGLPVHLDGARIFNAAAALGTTVRELSSGFSTVMFCLSKGLCAPVGSLLVGSQDHITQARVFRKALGGGMRQVGVLAAPGIIALEQMPARLHEDHENARWLAERLAHHPSVDFDANTVETNIVIYRLKNSADAAHYCARLKEQGVLASAIGPDAVRLVTHRDVNRAACEQALKALVSELPA
jgi:threonine aldolase